MYTGRESRRWQRVPHQRGTSRSSAAGRATWFPRPPTQTIQVPVAKNPDGSASPDRSVCIHDLSRTYRAAGRFPAASPRRIRLYRSTRRRRRSSRRPSETRNGREEGRCEDCEHRLGVCGLRDDAVSGKTRSSEYLLKNGFDPALLYELQYTAKDPLVLGIGLAATRDLGAFFRYEKADAAGTPNPVAGRIRCDLRGQLAVGHVPANLAAARLQSGRARAHRVGRDEPAHRRAIYRPEPAVRVSGRTVELYSSSVTKAPLGGTHWEDARP